MRIRFWGTRGSIAKPSPATLRYGGNTSCVEVRTERNTLIVLDCGTGAHGLGQALLEEGAPREGHLLISHTHWDHIQGLPFFEPLFAAEHQWDVYGPRGLGPSLRDTLAGQMQYTYFPITVEQFDADVRYHDLVEGSFEIGEVRVMARYLNHPALTLGYRLEADGATLVYATDHEPHSRQLARGQRRMQNREDEQHTRFLADADLLIHDAQYTAAEYPKKLGWGHSPVEYVVDVARAAGVRRLALFHHDPLRDDEALDRIAQEAGARAAGAEAALEVFAAAEGFVLDLEGEQPDRSVVPTADAPAAAQLPPTPADRAVLVAVRAPDMAAVLSEAVRADGLRLLTARDADAALRIAAAERPSVVILERELAGRDALEVCRALHAQAKSASDDPAVVVVADQEGDVDVTAGDDAGVTDWMVRPFKSTHARTRVRCWLLRTACQWARAPLPEHEEQRVRALHELGVLDTEPEDRFDRHTRIAAALFDTPIALVSLIDTDRQWFKSRHGLDASETPREMAFCAHAILGSEVFMVTDALRDPRFADNPLVTGPPHVRFYAGVPLAVKDGHRVGTLCLIDHRPRQLDDAELSLLRDLGKLVEQELERSLG